MDQVEAIKLALESGTVTQLRLAELSGVTQSAISYGFGGRNKKRGQSPRYTTVQALHAALLRHLGEALSVADGPDHADAVAYLERVRGKWGQAAAERLQAEARAAFEIQADVAEEVG